MLATEVLNSRRCDCEANHKCAHCIHCDIITPVTIRAAMRSIKRASDDVETALNLCASLYMLIGETQMKHRGRITNAKVYVYGTNSEPDICFHTRNYTGSKFTGSKYKRG